MSRDYKSRKSTSSRSGSKGLLFVGIFIGYTLGIMSAIGIWFYLEQAPSPFLSEEQISRYDRPDADSASKNPSDASESKDDGTSSITVEEKKQFGFYDSLSDEDESQTLYEMPQHPEQPKEVEQPPAVVKLDSLSESTLPSLPATAEREPFESISDVVDAYYLQAGSFRSDADADNLKARLALLGVVASVQSVDLSDKGVWYRVRVGPFTKKDRMDQVHHTLRRNGIEAQFIKVR